LLCVLLGSSGCALLVSANAHHNSRGTACVDTPAFGFIDLVIGGLAAAGVAASDEHEGWYAVPGVFLLSGTVGSIYAFKCQDENAPKDNPDNATRRRRGKPKSIPKRKQRRARIGGLRQPNRRRNRQDNRIRCSSCESIRTATS
jgi:hypothetical protein